MRSTSGTSARNLPSGRPPSCIARGYRRVVGLAGAAAPTTRRSARRAAVWGSWATRYTVGVWAASARMRSCVSRAADSSGRRAVDDAAQHQVLAVGAVTAEQDGVIAVLDDDPELARGVAVEGHEGDVAGRVSCQALRERPVGVGPEIDDGRREPVGPAVVGIAAQAPAQARGDLEVRARDEDLGAGEVVQAAGVVGVQVGQHDPAHVARRDPEPRAAGARSPARA